MEQSVWTASIAICVGRFATARGTTIFTRIPSSYARLTTLRGECTSSGLTTVLKLLCFPTRLRFEHGSISPNHLILLVLALILFGPSKLGD